MTSAVPQPQSVPSGASEVIHHEGYDEAIRSPFVPVIRSVSGARLVFISGVTGAPVYHDHPHVAEVFDAVPRDIDGQVHNLFEHLDQALRAAGAERSDVVSLTRFFTNVEDDQDVVNRVQGEWFGGHIPTSATVEVTRLATDARLRLEIQAIAAVPAD
ncbi:RidA family protein [Parafrigoribacterium humi]|jgi:enamine deaminase RidA (YjgF/YER057c/UK114 family)|uniref:RidA family protein n=1 Tax=Parafrigoribacterium humi TaxID=3144664 RepID=UPI0032EECE7E